MRGAVLAGGMASRYGGKPKGLEKVGGERILDRVVRVLQAATGEAPVVIANSPDAQSWVGGLTVIKDMVTDCGSLGGLYTAVASGSGPVLVVAWDMPFLTVDLLAALMKGANGYDLFLPESDSKVGVEPMCGVYGPACREPIKRMLEDEDFRATGFHEHVKRGVLPLAEIEKFDTPDTLFFNVNSPSDLKHAEALWRNKHA